MLKTNKKFVKDVLKAVKFLHDRCLSHRDISLENILLAKKNDNKYEHEEYNDDINDVDDDNDDNDDNNDEYIAKLMDFGVTCITTDKNGNERFVKGKVGKEYYRAPEMYEKEIMVDISEKNQSSISENIQYQRVLKKVHAAYKPKPTDMFAVGVCMFILFAARPLWQQAAETDPIFQYVKQNGIDALLFYWNFIDAEQWHTSRNTNNNNDNINVSSSSKATTTTRIFSDNGLDLLKRLLEFDPTKRINVDDALNHPWFQEEE